MRSKFKYFMIIWILIVITFNVVVFAVPRTIAGIDRFTGSFWVGYAFVTIMLISQLAIGWLTFKEENLSKLFYNISLVRISYAGMITMGVVGMICMLIPILPVWVGIIICLLVLIFNVIALVSTHAAISTVEEIDKKVKADTFFIKSLTVDVEMLKEKATIPEVANELKPLYDAVRYSDPMSDDALSSIESQITLLIPELSEGVEKADIDVVKRSVKNITVLLSERNKKCKLLK
ncbi:hypothetical protein SAMN04487770_12955 [Butyrivibrio sp. ob235]|uniref:hypothetical protein n=1 Tax=Butyrivibrio sp. ob235 TaxID=1761780 RepID=UPI0008BB7AE4|nr:hypothetical protein [Butyrivibrio sp. ob235]SEM23088.1 hypothetical protein SAMN04487770_12955 [Butyrivibrio sp. ob235]